MISKCARMLQSNWSAVTIMLNKLQFNSSFNYKIRDKYKFALVTERKLGREKYNSQMCFNHIFIIFGPSGIYLSVLQAFLIKELYSYTSFHKMIF